jgi:tape measure domain-containing protein
MATSTSEIILKFNGDPRQLKGVIAEIRADLSKFSTSQVSSARDTNRQLASEATKQTKTLEREERARMNAALSLQRQRSAALIAQWRAEEREQVRIAREAARQVEAAQAASQARRSAFISGAVGGVTALVGVSAINEIRQAGEAWLDYSNKLQTTQIAFTTMMGSAQLAQDHLKELQQFALKTPFQFAELIDASQRMQALGFRAEQVIPILTDVGNAVAAAGGGSERLDRVTLALSQIQSKGKVMTQELNQLAEAGIPAFKILQETLHKSRSEINDLVKDGQISSKVFIDAFQKFSQQNFGGLMEAQSKTFSGAMSNIKDALLQTSATAFAPLFEKLTQTAVHFSEASQSSVEFKKNLETVGQVSATIFDGLVELIHSVRDAIRIVAATISGEVTFVVELLREGSHLSAAILNEALAAIKSAQGDAAKAAEFHKVAQNELREAAVSATKAFDAQANIVKTIADVYREAEERAKALANAQQKVGVDVGFGGGIAQKKRVEETEDDLTKKTKAKADPGISLLRQLQGELRGLTSVTKAQEIAQQLLDTQYKDTNASLRQQIIIAAQLIDLAKQRIETDKLIKAEIEKQKQATEAAAESVTQFMREQAETLRELQFGPKSAVQETEEFIAKISLVPGAIHRIDEEWLRYRAHLIDSIERMKEMLDLMREQAAVVPGPGTGKVPELDPRKVFDPDATIGLPPPPDFSMWEDGLSHLRLMLEDFSTFATTTVKFAMESLADGLGDAARAWVLYGESIGKALKRALAETLASIAAQALVQAALHAAYAIGDLAFGNFASAAQHGIAAAKFAAVAAIAGLAGRAIAGNSFNGKGPGSTASSGGGSGGGSRVPATSSSSPKPVDLDRTSRNQQAITLLVNVKQEPGAIVQVTLDDHRNNGPIRQMILSEIKG